MKLLFRCVLAVPFIALFAPCHALGQSGTVGFSSQAYSIKESGTAARITLVRVGGTAGSLSVDFMTADGTAAAGDDYTSTSGSLTFGPGVTAMSFHVAVENDLEYEANETITLELTGDAVGEKYNATLTVLDNDSCAFALSPASRTHDSQGGLGSIAVTATAGCDWTATESADWMAIISGTSHTGSGEVQYSCDPYQGATTRSAILSIAGRNVTVTQQGVFFPVAGSYNGVFHEESVAQHRSSGFLALKLTEQGAFTARMTLGGKRHSFSGRFALDGRSTNTIIRPGTEPLIVTLALEFATEQITGEITDGTWTSLLVSDRAVFNRVTNPAPQAGRYTLVIRGDVDNSINEPGGDSFGAVTVDASGNAKLSGTLADGTKITQRVSLSQDGAWPLYVPLYRNAGSIISRVLFADEPESDLSGTLIWFKPAAASARYYPEGFAESQPLLGSRYQPPANATDQVLSFSSGAVEFSGGNLSEAFTNSITVNAVNKVVSPDANRLTLTLALPTGLFSGNVTPPGAARSVPLKGAIHQKGANDFGAGFFLGTGQSGRIYIHGQPPAAAD